jgi:hypothetical protein
MSLLISNNLTVVGSTFVQVRAFSRLVLACVQILGMDSQGLYGRIDHGPIGPRSIL